MFLLVFILLIIIIALYVKNYYEWVNKYPVAGEKPYPFLGNLLTVPPMDQIHEYFYERSKAIKADVFTVFIPNPVVILTSFDAIKEALVDKGQLTYARPIGYPDKFFQKSPNKGIIFNNGENWQAQRRVSISALRDFGMGKNLMEDRVHRSIDSMIEFVDRNKDKPLNFRWPVQICISNIISDVLFGITHAQEKDDDFEETVNLLEESFRLVRKDKRIYLYCFFNNYPKIISLLERFVNVNGAKEHQTFRTKVAQITKETAKSFVPHTEPTNFVHYYLNKADSMGGDINIEELYEVASDMLIAGLETTTTTTLHGLNHLGANLDKQDKMRDEILSVIGSDALITMKDKIRLPYCTATIMEIQRYGNIVPLNVSHYATADVEVQGVLIPKNTTIFAHIHSVLKYDKDFVDSDKFIPERWLNEDQKSINKTLSEKLIPFSMGKRQCAGEGMAVMELFLLITRLVQKYKFGPPPGRAKPSIEPICGAILKAPEYEFQVTDV
uniref:Cytochrome P450 n=1 Tax=Rhabditophanes sp. KR3021 TaxID=114890 RepID=A0AC35UAA3_9BILA